MIKKQLLIVLFVLSIFCVRAQNNFGGNYSFEIECMESELDGSITVKSWGNGKDFADAKDQAQKNAVECVLFKGITDGKPGCPVSPIVNDYRVKERNKVYFAEFFKDDAEYSQFVSSEDQQKNGRKRKGKKEAIESVTYCFVVRVDVVGLESKLKSDGIIK
jgi:hypothetical protein